MSQANYSVERVLQLIRISYRAGMGEPDYRYFLQRLWKQLELLNDPAIVKPAANSSYFDNAERYRRAPQELHASATQAFLYLLNHGYIYPKPTDDFINFPFSFSNGYRWSDRGQQWILGSEPVPEDAHSYMDFLRNLILSLDSIIDQYVSESLIAFNRDAYFAAAVMIGAASEKAIYLLAESMRSALQNPKNQDTLDKTLRARKLEALFALVSKWIQAANLPYDVTEGSEHHLTSLFDAIRVQRNDAVHPMNATVSSSSVRLAILAFPHALAKSEELRRWFLANPNSLSF